jgi:hypothetical protein
VTKRNTALNGHISMRNGAVMGDISILSGQNISLQRPIF